jgi:hypothetical protein
LISSSTQSGKKSLRASGQQEDLVLSMMSDAFRQRAEEKFYKEVIG